VKVQVMVMVKGSAPNLSNLPNGEWGSGRQVTISYFSQTKLLA
jgi:hypothetical protein